MPHGVICGTLMAMANEINVRELRKGPNDHVALKKYATLGKLFLEEKGKSDDYYIDGFVRYLHNQTSELQLPGLGKYGLNKNDMKDICSSTDCKNNPVKLNMEELIEILERRI
jgi:alcohol dehydrogenase class IV